jgi:hypothetical protein
MDLTGWTPMYAYFVGGQLVLDCLGYRGHGRGILVNYDELPEFACAGLPAHFGLTLSPSEVDRMRAVSLADAKTPR